MRTKNKCAFHVGQSVTKRFFKDCFGKDNEEIKGMTVAEIKLIKPKCMAPYYRIVAIKDTGPVRYYDAAEHFYTIGA